MALSGWASDLYGRKRIMILSLVLAAVPAFLFTLVGNLWILILLGVIYAMSFAVFVPARIAYIADSSKSASLARTYGYMNLAFPIGTLVGPTVAGLLADMGGFSYPFYFVVLVSLFCFVPAIRIFERSITRRDSGRDGVGISGLSREDLNILLILTIYQFLVSAGIGAVHSFLPIYLSDVFLVDKLYVGVFFSVVGIALFGSQLFGGWACTRFGMKKIMLTCLSLIVPFFIVCSFAPNYQLFTICYMALFGLYGTTWPAAVTMFTSTIESSKRGFVTGIRQMGVRLGFTVGPAIGGFLWATFGPAASFYASAILILVSMVFLFQIKENER
ncbi:MAG: MFS transporter, partial [Candidatus Bathyarchaeia archaeon]